MKTKSLLFPVITLLLPMLLGTSVQATITTWNGPAPATLTVEDGQTATFTVQPATDNPPISAYQWRKNGTNVPGANGPIYSFQAVYATDDGAVLDCIVTDADGPQTSPTTATLTVTPLAAVVLTDVQDQTVVVGQRATFTIVADGTEPLTYQWWRRPSGGAWAIIPGATQSSYRTVPTTLSDDGTEFQCEVTSAEGTDVYSRVATLTVEPRLPSFIIHPQNRAVEAGGVAVFRVWALGTDLEYQWQTRPSGGAWTDITGAIDPAYSTGPVNIADHHDRRYRCRANNAGYTTYVYSNEGTLTVIGAATITSHPVDQTVDEGETATFSITASGVGTLSYQWEKMPFGGAWAAIPGATGTSYTTPPATMSDDRAQFRCSVTNAAGSVTSGSLAISSPTYRLFLPRSRISPLSLRIVPPGSSRFSRRTISATACRERPYFRSVASEISMSIS